MKGKTMTTQTTNSRLPLISEGDSEYYEFAAGPTMDHLVMVSSDADQQTVSVTVSQGSDRALNGTTLTYAQARALRDALDKMLAFEHAV